VGYVSTCPHLRLTACKSKNQCKDQERECQATFLAKIWTTILYIEGKCTTNSASLPPSFSWIF
jgi:hypothetical protein